MTDVNIRRIDKTSVSDADKSAMKRVLAAAFAGYAPHMAIWHNEAANTRLMDEMVEHFLRRHEVVAAYIGDHVAGVALWVPPGHEFMSDAEAEGMNSLSLLPPKRGEFVATRVLPAIDVLTDASFPDAEEEWHYLFMLATDPTVQGSGVGSALLAHKIAERGDVPLCLHTNSERNARFYARTGFTQRAEHNLPLPFGAVWNDRFFTLPADASTRAMRELAAEAEST
ncbi:Puromycin N-acetyltransferase [Vanrija pseudolonga]|uniref:Puromycin N-acetyltransferase n=1 Tax=Vanrija pseudolonga TaxID=143232 RepID=A0AAF1BGB6_9TREE|nr:Puromycin N-acetyltransferase [Vanrija pseudolonga]